jgi:peptidoglycan-associated lipoprotein
MMKVRNFLNLVAVSLILCSSMVGCKKGQQKVTPIPGLADRGITGEKASPPINAAPVPPPDSGIGKVPIDPNATIPTSKGDFSQWTPDRDKFAAQTVYFEYDKSTVKSSETSKLDAVASAMKSSPGKALRIEGHCDERGTEEYNRSLGERRALALREYLVHSGLNPELVETISFGEDKPADPGHDDRAWSKNRRGEFVLLSPPGGGAQQ